jgi:hypothetical protein
MATRAGASGVVGVLGAPAVAYVDERGELSFDGCTLSWLVGAEDRWHDPRGDAAVRQQRALPAPAYETRMRVPSGDAVHRVYGALGRNGARALVVEIENASPAPFAIALVVRTSPGRHRVDVAGTDVHVDGRAVLVLPRPPMRWAAATATEGTQETVTTGLARPAPFEAFEGDGAEAALVFPLSHRSTFRVAVPFRNAGDAPLDVDDFPPLELVQHGWSTQLDRGMRVELPGTLGERVDGARASALLEGSLDAPGATTIANLEDWGFDQETSEAWKRASFRTRRHAARREPPEDDVDLASLTDEGLLRHVRDLLVTDGKDVIDLVPGFRPEWAGASLTVHDAPTRAGLVSFALRWHGERPALLWDAPDGVRLRAPALDPSWSAHGGQGETLLRAWQAPAPAAPAAVDDPEPAVAEGGSFE